MLVKDCMTKDVELAASTMTIREAAQKMRSGNFGCLPIGDDERLIGMITDRDIVIRAVADGRNPDDTFIRDVMSNAVLYCYEDQSIDEVTRNMGEKQVRRLPVLNRNKRLVGLLSLGDVAASKHELTGEALGKISDKARTEAETRY